MRDFNQRHLWQSAIQTVEKPTHYQHLNDEVHMQITQKPTALKPSVYLETSFISYLTGPLSQNMMVATHQRITREWWKTRRLAFELLTSPWVIEEVRRGNATQATKRLTVLQDIPSLKPSHEVMELAEVFLQQQVVPGKVSDDAYHIAVATVHQVNYLLTWNCKHIANAQLQTKLRQLSQQRGYELPILCTPYELLTQEI